MLPVSNIVVTCVSISLDKQLQTLCGGFLISQRCRTTLRQPQLSSLPSFSVSCCTKVNSYLCLATVQCWMVSSLTIGNYNNIKIYEICVADLVRCFRNVEVMAGLNYGLFLNLPLIYLSRFSLMFLSFSWLAASTCKIPPSLVTKGQQNIVLFINPK